MKIELEMFGPDELDAFATFIQSVASQRRNSVNQGYNAYREWIGEPASSNAQVAEPLTADEQVDFPDDKLVMGEELRPRAQKARRTRKAKAEPETVEQPTIDAVAEAEAPPEPEPEETTTDMDVAPEEIAPIDFPSEPLDMKPATLEDLRAAFTGIYSRAPNRTAGQEAIMAVLGKFKAKNASGVAPEQLADAIAECNAQFAK